MADVSSELAIPWRRLFSLIRPLWRRLAGMVSLSVSGSVIGLLPPIALGFLVNNLAAGHNREQAAIWVGVIVAALLAEAGAYALSDGISAGVSARLYRDLRMLMLGGAIRQHPEDPEQVSGLVSRFVSDAEAVESITVSTIDLGTVGLVELGAALIALGLFDPWAVGLAALMIVLAAFTARYTQLPAARAGRRRQEELERMSRTLARELGPSSAGSKADQARSRFREAARRLLRAEVRLGWLQALNTHGSGALAGLGPILVVVVAALQGGFKAGTLLTLYLLSARAFQGGDDLIDLSLDAQVVRGAVARCFELTSGEADIAES
jgi:ABC-type multidrug transport system fused ATPase/permease subunit